MSAIEKQGSGLFLSDGARTLEARKEAAACAGELLEATTPNLAFQKKKRKNGSKASNLTNSLLRNTSSYLDKPMKLSHLLTSSKVHRMGSLGKIVMSFSKSMVLWLFFVFFNAVVCSLFLSP